MYNEDLKGKNVLVTGGGGTGVGRGVCKVLDACGVNIILNEMHFEDAKQAAEQYRNALPVEADITSEKAVLRMFRQIKKEAGLIHGLVNNAGIGLSKPAHQASQKEFDKVYDTDMKGLWLVSRAFVQQLSEADQPGNIVNISSVHAHATMSRYAVYASAKAAVEGFTRGLAVELGPMNIRVNAIAPGYVHADHNYELIKTWADNPQQWVQDHVEDQQVLLREILPEDCGNVAAFLLSDCSRAVTGQTICVDNGTTCLLYNRYFTEKP